MEVTQVAPPIDGGAVSNNITNTGLDTQSTSLNVASATNKPITGEAQTTGQKQAQDLKTKSTTKRKWLKVLKWTGYITGYGILGLIGLAKTPGIQVAVNDLLQVRGITPTPTNTRTIDTSSGYDAYFRNYPGFQEISREAELHVNPQSLDINNNGIILDSQAEIQLLRQKLVIAAVSSKEIQRQNEINNTVLKLDEINIANQLLWGSNPDPNYLFQRGRPNCQLMGAIQAHYLTPENLQILKNLIEVTNFDPNTGRIDTVVHLQNSRSITVPFEDLVRWMSPLGISPSYSADGTPDRPITLAVPILTYALEKELSDNYDGVPPTIPSSAPILLTGKNYSSIFISPIMLNTFTDGELANIFSMAPQRPIMLSSWGTMNDLDNWFNRTPNNGFNFIPQSDAKAYEFQRSIEMRAQGIIASREPNKNTTSSNLETTVASITNIPGIASSEPQNNQNQTTTVSPTTNTLTTQNILRHHIYVVRGYNPTDNTVIIMDSHGTNSSIKLNELRSMWKNDGMVALIMQRDDIPTVSNESLEYYLLFLLIATGHFALYRHNKKKQSNIQQLNTAI